MTNSANLQKAFELAVEQYETLGVNVDRALERLRDVAISVHCWQGDDVVGFEGNDGDTWQRTCGDGQLSGTGTHARRTAQ